MGHSQSRKKKKEETLLIKSENTSIEKSMSSNCSEKSEIEMNKSSENSVQIHRRNNSVSQLDKPSNSKMRKTILQKELNVFEHEDSIERRKRIMAGDRRNCYIMKLGTLRQAKENKLAEEKRLYNKITMKKLIHSSTENKTSVFFNSIDKKMVKHVTEIKEDKTMKMTINDNKNYFNCESLKPNCESNTVRDCIAENQQSIKQSKCQSLPGMMKRNCEQNVSSTQSQIIRVETLMQENEKSCYPLILECNKKKEKVEPQNSTKFSVKSNTKDELYVGLEMEDSIKSPKISTEKKEKKILICNTLMQRNEIYQNNFMKCSDIKNNSYYNVTNNSHNITIPGYNSTITFESDYSTNGFESDIKSELSIESFTNSKNQNISSSTVHSCPTENSSATLISYQKVKQLFKKRMKQTEIEEKFATKCSGTKKNIHYKELEALGRGNWINGVWVPSGILTESIRHKICRENS